MKNRRNGFTLVELMVVVLIVGILVATAIPIIRGRADSAKWTEGKAMAGNIATNLRAWAAEHGGDYSDPAQLGKGTYYAEGKPDEIEMGFQFGDFTGTYFDRDNYSWTTHWESTTNTLAYTIKVTRGLGINSPEYWELNQTGIWVDSVTLGFAGK